MAKKVNVKGVDHVLVLHNQDVHDQKHVPLVLEVDQVVLDLQKAEVALGVKAAVEMVQLDLVVVQVVDIQDHEVVVLHLIVLILDQENQVADLDHDQLLEVNILDHVVEVRHPIDQVQDHANLEVVAHLLLLERVVAQIILDQDPILDQENQEVDLDHKVAVEVVVDLLFPENLYLVVSIQEVVQIRINFVMCEKIMTQYFV